MLLVGPIRPQTKQQGPYATRRGDRTTPPITSFDYHVLREGVAFSLIPTQVMKTGTETCVGALSKWAKVETEYNGFWFYRPVSDVITL